MSSIWQEDDSTRLVWITLLASANRHGEIEASPIGIAHAARVPLAACLKALEKFAGPDEMSRSADYDGRRIEKVDGGYRLLNYERYRNTLSVEDRREYQRVKQAEYRAKKKGQGGRRPGVGRPRVGDLSVPTASERLREKLERDGDEAGALRVQEMAAGMAPGALGSYGPEAQAVMEAKAKRTAVGPSTESSGESGVSEASAAEIQHASAPVLEGPASVSTPPPDDDMPDPDAVPVPEV